MKRNLLIAFILAGLVTGISGQDRIITLNNDTVECKINKVTRSDIHFDITTGSVRTARKIPLENVLNFSVAPAADSEVTYRSAISDANPRILFGINGGSGYSLSGQDDLAEVLEGYGLPRDKAIYTANDLRSGVCISSELFWFITPKLGTGVRYKYFHTTISIEEFFDQATGEYNFYVPYARRIYMNFTGPSFMFTDQMSRHGALKYSVAFTLGQTTYRDEIEFFFLSENSLQTGKAFGMEGSLGLDYRISHSFSAGIEFSAFRAVFKKLAYTDGTESFEIELPQEMYENLSRIDFGFRLRFFLWDK